MATRKIFRTRRNFNIISGLSQANGANAFAVHGRFLRVSRASRSMQSQTAALLELIDTLGEPLDVIAQTRNIAGKIIDRLRTHQHRIFFQKIFRSIFGKLALRGQKRITAMSPTMRLKSSSASQRNVRLSCDTVLAKSASPSIRT